MSKMLNFRQQPVLKGAKILPQNCRLSKIFSCTGVALLGFVCTSLNPVLATDVPTLKPSNQTSAPGSYAASQRTVVMDTADAGATINYTLTGADPVFGNSPIYTAGTTGIVVPNNTVVKAISTVSGVSSAVNSTLVDYDVPRTELQLWLKPDQIISSGGFVSSWVDSSGLGTRVVQANTNNQPSLVTGIYGYPAVSFNGASTNSSYMTITQSSTNAKFLNNLTNGFSIFAVIKPLTSTTLKSLLSASVTGVTDLTALQTNNTAVTYNANNAATTSTIVTAANTLTVGTFQLVGAVHDTGTTGHVKINSLLSNSGTVKTLRDVARSTAYLGGNNALATNAFWGGQLLELLIYGRGVTPSEEAAIEAYLASKYQTNVAQFTTAPIFSQSSGSTFAAPIDVAIAAGPNAQILFTTDGSNPSPGGSTTKSYTGPIHIGYSQTVKAIAVANNVQSSIVSASYVLDSLKFPAPNLSDLRPLQINLQLPTVSIPQ